MKDYHDFKKIYLGSSDIADLLIRGSKVDSAKEIHMGYDGSYYGYIIDDASIELPERYKLIFEDNAWIWLFSDLGRTLNICAKNIKVYQSGSTLAFIIDGLTRIETIRNEITL